MSGSGTSRPGAFGANAGRRSNLSASLIGLFAISAAYAGLVSAQPGVDGEPLPPRGEFEIDRPAVVLEPPNPVAGADVLIKGVPYDPRPWGSDDVGASSTCTLRIDGERVIEADESCSGRHTFESAGTHVVEIVMNMGRPRRITREVDVGLPPVRLSASRTNVEEDDAVTFTAEAAHVPRGAVFRYDFGDGQEQETTRGELSHRYDRARDEPYRVTATLSQGTIESESNAVSIEVSAAPVVAAPEVTPDGISENGTPPVERGKPPWVGVAIIVAVAVLLAVLVARLARRPRPEPRVPRRAPSRDVRIRATKKEGVQSFPRSEPTSASRVRVRVRTRTGAGDHGRSPGGDGRTR